MELVEPQLSRVVPLFRALHTYHAELDPSVYHCDGPEDEYLKFLQSVTSRGGRVFAHDAGWGLVSYVLAKPEITERDALRVRHSTMRVEHLYVSPMARGLGLAQHLIARVEDWARDLGFDGWYVIYHCDNPGAAKFYASVAATPLKGISQKRIA